MNIGLCNACVMLHGEVLCRMKHVCKYRRLFFFFVLFVFAVPYQGASINITAQVDSSTVLIGKQVNFSISVIQKYGENVVYPVYADTLIDKVEVLRSEFSDTIPVDENTFEIQQNFLITSFDTGAYMLPVGPFVINAQGSSDTVYGMPVFLAVETVAVDTTKEFIDIKPPIEAPFQFAELYPILKIILWVLIGLVLLAALVYAVYYFIKRYKVEEEETIVAVPKDPPHETAFRELEILKNEELWQKKLFKQYYSRLTEILRVYIEDKFDVLALESTTDEIILDLKRNTVIDFASVEILEQILKVADLSKFAKAEPGSVQNEQNFSLAYDFISRTKMLNQAEGVTDDSHSVNVAVNVKKND